MNRLLVTTALIALLAGCSTRRELTTAEVVNLQRRCADAGGTSFPFTNFSGRAVVTIDCEFLIDQAPAR